VSEWERREREEESKAEVEELCNGGEIQPLVLPMPSFLMSPGEE